MLPTSKSNMVFEEKFTYKNNQMILRNYSQISQQKGKKGLLGMYAFSTKV